MAEAQRQSETIREQADFLASLAWLCETAEQTPRAETWVVLNAREAAMLRSIARRLDRMAPCETSIRDLVVTHERREARAYSRR